MIKQTLVSLIFTLILFFCSCSENKAREFSSGDNVILITLDGVRYQEFFNGMDPALSGGATGEVFSHIWKDLAQDGVIYGSPGTSSKIEVANPYRVSLPAYESIFAGSVRDCKNNSCNRVDVETFPERLLREFSWKKSQVAAIASWDKIALAFESNEGSTALNAGLEDIEDPDGGVTSADFEKINKLQKLDPPNWEEVRFDKHTVAQALIYLTKYRPRFLYISLNDSDEYGHMGDYANYVNTLHTHDSWIQLLFKTLEDLGEYGKRTTVIVTTDHGRGANPKDWRDHGAWVNGCEKIWLFAKGPYTAKTGILKTEGSYTHLNIRPTVETLLGLTPCAGCADPLPEVIQGMNAPEGIAKK